MKTDADSQPGAAGEARSVEGKQVDPMAGDTPQPAQLRRCAARCWRYRRGPGRVRTTLIKCCLPLCGAIWLSFPYRAAALTMRRCC